MRDFKGRDILQAWMDGKDIQYYSESDAVWKTYIFSDPPYVCHYHKWRIKPETGSFRAYVTRRYDGRLLVGCINNKEYESKIEERPEFVKWLGDWQEVVV